MKYSVMFLFYLLLLTGNVGYSRSGGDFFYRNFTANELKASDWIQSITQNNLGMIYAGNNLGTVIEYDGSIWRNIPVSNGAIRALKSDDSGRIYVGSFGEFGFLEPSGNGRMSYHSLMSKVPGEDKDISDIWSIEICGEDVFFRSVERIFRLRNDTITAFSNPYGWFGNLITLDGQVYVTLDNKGIILKFNGDSLVKIFESAAFRHVVFGTSAHYEPGKKLVGSWGGGLYVFCPANIGRTGRSILERIPTAQAKANTNLLRVAGVYEIEPGLYAGRTDNGIMVFDDQGAEKVYMTTANGLKSDLIETVYSDRNHVLWIGTEKGITRVDIFSPISSWYSLSESTGTVWGIISYSNTIYFWGIKGIFRLNNNKAENIHSETFGLVEFTEPEDHTVNHLLAINYNSLVEIKSNRLYQLVAFPEPLLYQQIFISKLHPDRIYLYGANGLYLIRFEKGKWLWEGNVADVTIGIQSFAEDDNGDLWLAVHNNRKLLRLMPDKSTASANDPPAFLKQLYEPSGDIAARWIRCFTVLNRAVLGTDKGIFRFDPALNQFVHDSTFGKRFTDGRHAVYILKEGDNGAIFIADRLHRQDDIGLCLPGADGSYKWYSRPFLSLTPHIRIYDACFGTDGSIWMISDEGLNRYDPLKDKKVPGEFNTLIREVIFGRDSMLFEGTYYTENEGEGRRIASLTQPESMKPSLPYRLNSVKFRFAAISFEGEDQNVYRYLLDGFDKEWSKWTTEGFKEYGNLPYGRYTFRVVAKNVFGIESNEATYQFNILPPWYATVWAFVAYFVLICLLIYGIVLLNLRRLRNANILLEKSVEERTLQIVSQKEEISLINENLLLKQEELETTLRTLYEMQEELIRSEKMASLGQLIAGIAHEINTPLGAIKASVNDINNNSRQILNRLPDLIKQLNGEQFKLFLELVNRSTRHNLPVSIKEERQYKKVLQKKFEDHKVPDAAYKADTLVDMGILDDVDPYIIILGNGNDNFLQVAYQMSQLIRNSSNIEIAIERASKIVQALKSYSHMHNIEEKIDSDIAEGIITVLTLYQNQLKRGIHLTTDFAPLPRILCYPDELNQVWTNLITNAIDAMNGKGELSIATGRSKDNVIIKVSDTGCGIPEGIHNRIFEAFFSTKPSGEGSGLGLFIIKEIIDKHGGKISFESQLGKGTVFTVSLPLITRNYKMN